ncbi:MAG: SGNH/GDSL hydrolase family protein [Tepidimonas sp.]|uniref:SGNH/GDSL hydrolase family protein n=1 Tax=Tepidimonas sp. TaxID=2002775 RepID=UPI00259ECF13|nr:SGNH/GDSL hydrolase family protein [Tepidimonas sp.]MDM7455843.1 SGNH/GDSL hydrolase family protein [Tepidimonas sp.]
MPPVWIQRMVTLAATAAMAGCLGSGSDVTAIKVAGDSLADAGAFGFKFTVQGPSLAQTRIWVDHVADAADVGPLCARYTATGPNTVAANPAATHCTSHAVGGARINVPGKAGDTTALSIQQQLRDLGASAYGEREVLLVVGGGNDAADLIGAYLGASADGGAAYLALLSELLSPAQVAQAAAAGNAGLAQAGGLYMAALADQLADTLQTQALAKGAKRVVVLNAPDVTRTPRFLALLAAVAQSSGGGATGAAVAEQIATTARAWVGAYNGRLAQRFATESRVAVVDFFGALNQWLTSPAAYGLSNTTTPACPPTGTDAQGLPTYSIQTCSEASLAATAPAGAGAGWWNRYVFSDNFHGTPRTNALMGNLVNDTLRARGWM